MAGTDKVAVKSGFNWRTEASELWHTALDLGKQYASGRIKREVGGTDNPQKAQQNESYLQTTATVRNIMFIGVAALGIWALYKFVK